MRPRRVLGAVAYWLAVLAISLALVIALVAWLNSRDHGSVHDATGSRAGTGAQRVLSENPRSRAKATIRWEAL
jgi:hypothetical protein